MALCEEEIGFCSGAAIALAILVRLYDQPTVAGDILREMGLTVEKMKAAGVDEYDLKPLRKALRETA